MGKLSLVFLQFVKVRADLPTDAEALERLLEDAVDTGQRGHRFTLDAGLFVDCLARRLAEEAPGGVTLVTLAEVLKTRHLGDLYLACACLHKVPEAIAQLEQLHLMELRTWIKRTDAVVDELCQNVRIQLLVGLTAAGPRLADYRGRGSLQNWIHVVASHLLPPRQRLSPGGTPEDHLLDVLEAIPFQGPNSETELGKRRIAHEFRQALKDAFAVLSREQRRLLRFYYLDQLTTCEVGRMIGKDQSTASRRLADARETVYEETIRLLRERLRLSTMEMDSLLVALGTSFDVSISRILGEPEEEEGQRPPPRPPSERVRPPDGTRRRLDS